MRPIRGSVLMIHQSIGRLLNKNGLLGLNKDLDEVWRRVMGIKRFTVIREAFAEVRREESGKI